MDLARASWGQAQLLEAEEEEGVEQVWVPLIVQHTQQTLEVVQHLDQEPRGLQDETSQLRAYLNKDQYRWGG